MLLGQGRNEKNVPKGQDVSFLLIRTLPAFLDMTDFYLGNVGIVISLDSEISRSPQRCCRRNSQIPT